jgi:hypothetical protein
MSSSIDTHRKKEYMTGYTGHVPNKQLIFGLTTGEMGRLLKKSEGKQLFYEGKHVNGIDRRK